MSQKRIVLVGGGTGGHFHPLIATAERLREQAASDTDLQLYYAGPEPYDAPVLAENNIRYIYVPAGKRRKYFSLLNLFTPFLVWFGIIVAFWKLLIIYPDVIFSKGGYTSVPVVIAAWLLRIPIMIHESDTRPGSANRMAGKLARYVAVAFDDVAKFFPAEKVALTGIPLRKVMQDMATDPFSALGLPNDRPLIFVTGGSQGALRLNNLILESLDELLPIYTILHQTGATHEETVKLTAAKLIPDPTLLSHYFVKGSLTATEMHLAESAATLIISRAGTGTIFEIAAKGKPSILIPIPEEISHDQRHNAYAYARTGAATVIEEANLTDGLLTAEINRIMGDTSVYETMQRAALQFHIPNAAETLATTLLGIADEHD